jgi:DNA ligase D
MTADETRDGVELTHLDQPLFDGADATKRELVDYVDAMSARLVAVLEDRPLSVIRVRAGQAPFMQKNLPKYAPDFVRSVTLWAETSKRDVAYALANDARTLLWLANQRAVEYHAALSKLPRLDEPTDLILDLDPPDDGFLHAARAAHLVHSVLDDVGLAGAVKTSGAKGLHVFVPLAPGTTMEAAAAATRALAERTARLDPSLATTAFMKEDRGGKVFIDATRAGGATVVAAYSPRVRPGVSVSFPIGWDQLDSVAPRDFTIKTVPGLLDGRDPWRDDRPAPQQLSDALVAEGHAIPIARVAAMHEGKRRKRSR